MSDHRWAGGLVRKHRDWFIRLLRLMRDPMPGVGGLHDGEIPPVPEETD